MNNVVVLENVTKEYKKKTVVDIVNLHIEENSIYGLIGPNGAGKSTTMKMICGLTNKTNGKISVDGVFMNEKNRVKILKKIGCLIESPAYYGNLSGYENLDIVKEYKGLKKQDIDEVLSIVGLTANKNKLVKEYSLGMKQRLGIAMALIGFPKIIILDEPTNGLDPQAMADIRNLIKSLPTRFGTTVMISSHALDEIEKMANKIGIIGNGKILYQGDIKSFKNRYSGEIHIRTSNNEKATMILENLNPKLNFDTFSINFVDDEEIVRILNILYINKISVYRVYEQIKSLEDLFLDFTKEEHL